MTNAVLKKDWIDNLPPVRGKIKADASLASTSWFKVGGNADVLFKPEDEQDLADFLKNLPSDIPVTVLGATSNIIIRDKGIRGVVIKLGRGFNDMTCDNLTVTAGAASLDVNVALFACDNGLEGLEFLIGIPGTVGGGLKMNAGAYGGEFKDVLDYCVAINRKGEILKITNAEMGFSYRHSETPEDYIFTRAVFKASGKQDKAIIRARIDEIKQKRESTQPITEKTGGSTFANPTAEECEAAGIPVMKSWELVVGAGGHEIEIGGAKMSEKHRNFMINHGTATAGDLETLGETIRQMVKDKYGITLRWEIKRIGEL